MEEAAHLDSEPKRAVLCGVRAKQPFSTQFPTHTIVATIAGAPWTMRLARSLRPMKNEEWV